MVGGESDSKSTHIVITKLLHDTAPILGKSKRGRVFALFQHPVGRIISQYRVHKTIDKQIAGMSLLEYAWSDHLPDNWMVRLLTNELFEPVTMNHLDVAKEVLRRKVIVGTLENLDESLVRFEKYYGWWKGIQLDPGQQLCQLNYLKELVAVNDYNDAPTDALRVLTSLNWADVQLYRHVELLFQEQATVLISGTGSLE